MLYIMPYIYMNTEYDCFMLLYLLVNNTYSQTRNQQICIPKATTNMTPCPLTSGWHRTLIILVVFFIATATGKHLHVRSTTSTTAACTQSASCHTLQELLQHSSHYFLSHMHNHHISIRISRS